MKKSILAILFGAICLITNAQNGEIVYKDASSNFTSSPLFKWLNGQLTANSDQSSFEAIFKTNLPTGNSTIYMDNSSGNGVRLRQYGASATGTVLGGALPRANNGGLFKSGSSNKMVIDGVTTDPIYIGGASGIVFTIDNSVPLKGVLVNGRTVFGGIATLKEYTVATLPVSPPPGSLAFVSDALNPVWRVAVVGGGTERVLVFYNGAWVCH